MRARALRKCNFHDLIADAHIWVPLSIDMTILIDFKAFESLLLIFFFPCSFVECRSNWWNIYSTFMFQPLFLLRCVSPWSTATIMWCISANYMILNCRVNTERQNTIAQPKQNEWNWLQYDQSELDMTPPSPSHRHSDKIQNGFGRQNTFTHDINKMLRIPLENRIEILLWIATIKGARARASEYSFFDREANEAVFSSLFFSCYARTCVRERAKTTMHLRQDDLQQQQRQTVKIKSEKRRH